jgi:NAD kinase
MISRIIVVEKKTPLTELLERHHTKEQATFVIESRGNSIEEYLLAHDVYHCALDTVLKGIPHDIPHTVLPREQISNFLFRERDLVVVVGPDGLCVNVAKYLNGQPIIGVNPDPDRIDGILVRIQPADIRRIVVSLIAQRYAMSEITLAQAVFNDRPDPLYAVNDFLIGRADQVSARYMLSFNGRSERQSSSGVLISTGVGSTGWISSILNGALAVTGSSTHVLQIPLPWNAKELLYAVREPFQSRWTGISLACGVIRESRPLTIVSEMPEGGVIFSDGVIEDSASFIAGTKVTITLADRVVRLVDPLI